MPSPLKVAVLGCDTPLPGIKARFGQYGGMHDVLLQKSVEALNRPDLIDPKNGLEVKVWDVVNGDQYPKLEDIDAILITGSKHNSFDDDPWILRLVDFTQQALGTDRIRIVGVCFGQQILARALGCRVGRGEGWEIGVHNLDLTDKGKEIFGSDSLRLQQSHRDVVHELPPDTSILASTSICAIHAMYSPGRFIAVQGHPEFDETIMSEIINARHGKGVYPDSMFDDSIKRAGDEHDGILAGMTFLRFLVDDLEVSK
ncbi:hypothetical protein FQN54_006136 [Arachnomyces sp. PD_36]|nr:hypothetical protein FQN54_006136 [Arachnomyces sp. PD_36]